LWRGRPARPWDGTAAAAEALPRRRPAAARRRATRLPAGHARVRVLYAVGPRRARPARASRRTRARASEPARANVPVYRHSRRARWDAGSALRRARGGGDHARRQRPAARARGPRTVRSTRGHADHRGPAMNAGDVLLWVIIPYLAIAVFVVGHVWRYR